jgi:transcriptional regulator with XRE-family HTH domain
MSTKKIDSCGLFSNRLTLLLKENRIRKNKLAEEIGLTPQAITHMTKGRSNPSPQTIKSIARFFKVTEDWLEYGTGIKDAEEDMEDYYASQRYLGEPEQPKTIAERIGSGYFPEVKLIADYMDVKFKGKTSEERLKIVEDIMEDIRQKYK